MTIENKLCDFTTTNSNIPTPRKWGPTRQSVGSAGNRNLVDPGYTYPFP